MTLLRVVGLAVERFLDWAMNLRYGLRVLAWHRGTSVGRRDVVMNGDRLRRWVRRSPRPAAVRPHQVARVVWLRRQRLVRPGRARRYLPPRTEGAEVFLGA